MLMLIFVWNLKGKVHVTRGGWKQWETFCAHTACVPAAFRNSRVIMSKSLLFWATTSQNLIHKFLNYCYKNSLYLFLFFFSFFSSIADLNLRHASGSSVISGPSMSVLNIKVVICAFYLFFIALWLLNYPNKGKVSNEGNTSR